MPLEGFLGSFKSSEPRAATADHPSVLQTVYLDTSVATVSVTLPVGTVFSLKENNNYGLYDEKSNTATSYAVLDAKHSAGDTKAICLLHGTVKSKTLQIINEAGTAFTPATETTFARLSSSGIFAI